ncbi:hypothetical protein MP638_001920 [Amoeboaphelidium occidentale]|nr:hypothetical protein MP638_001920 [Amoeboaphelidium occidentale]
MADISVKFYQTKDSTVVVKETDTKLTPEGKLPVRDLKDELDVKTLKEIEGKLPVRDLKDELDVKTLKEIEDGEAFLIGADEHGDSLLSFAGKTAIKVTGEPKGIVEEPMTVKQTFRQATPEHVLATTGVDYELKQGWDSIAINADLVPSDEFVALYKKNASVFFMNSEASRRTVIDLFLREIVAMFPELMIIPEFTMSVQNKEKRRRLNGQIDYSVCHRQHRDEPHLIVVEAKKDVVSPSNQYFAECASLYYQRKIKNKVNHHALGIHTSGASWKFLCINQDGVAKESKELFLNVNSYIEEEVNDVYRHVYFVVQESFK